MNDERPHEGGADETTGHGVPPTIPLRHDLRARYVVDQKRRAAQLAAQRIKQGSQGGRPNYTAGRRGKG